MKNIEDEFWKQVAAFFYRKSIHDVNERDLEEMVSRHFSYLDNGDVWVHIPIGLMFQEMCKRLDAKEMLE